MHTYWKISQNQNDELKVTKLVYDDDDKKIDEITTEWISPEEIMQKFKTRS